MKIRSKLALRFVASTGLVLLFIMILIFYFSERSREREFYNTLKKEAITKANLFLEQKIDPEILQLIYKNSRTLLDEIEIAIYDTNRELVYHDAVNIDIVKETPEMFNLIEKKDTIQFKVDKHEGIGIYFHKAEQSYFVTAAAFDGYGLAKQQTLALILFVSALLNIITLFILSYHFAKAALSPMQNIVAQVKHITAEKLKLRVPVDNSKDELGELSITFNEMLDRLEHSFQSQQHLVNSISHELRTPLAALVAELDIAEMQASTVQEFKEAVMHASKDTKSIIKLTNGLLDLAKSKYSPNQIIYKEVRVDELLVDARALILRSNPEYKVDLIFEELPEEEFKLMVNANYYLLKTAFCNLIENNCKFSDNHHSLIQVSIWDNHIYIKFTDTGIGISKENIEKIFEPFYRIPNDKQVNGYGIGMTLCLEVFLLHRGSIQVFSELGHGTTFEVQLPHIL